MEARLAAYGDLGWTLMTTMDSKGDIDEVNDGMFGERNMWNLTRLLYFVASDG
jgi:hypothetical protein